jgi:hypothetical protein
MKRYEFSKICIFAVISENRKTGEVETGLDLSPKGER